MRCVFAIGRSGRPRNCRRFPFSLLAGWVLFGTLVTAGAQGVLDEARFDDESLRLRTALHEDPLLDAPLDALVRLYQGADRNEELVGLYRNHLSSYPTDAGAKTVLVRILRRINRARAEELLASAAPRHPEYAPLQYLLYRFMEERGDPRAAQTLSMAIDLETSPTRRRAWLELLLQTAETEEDRNLARSQFEKEIGAAALGPGDALSLARLLQRYRFWETSVTALNRARGGGGDAEVAIEVEMMLATALAQLGNGRDAGAMLDALIRRLAPDHWRRREILSLRVLVVGDGQEREEFLETLRNGWLSNPKSEVAALDYAEVLAAAELRDEAVEVLLQASREIPQSTLLEARVVDLLEILGDRIRLAAYLVERLDLAPDRDDLRLRLVKVSYALGRDAEAEQDFRVVVAGLPPEEASIRILELQRHLRGIDRADAAAPYLESYLRNHPSRLDVARELFEIRLGDKGRGDAAAILRMIDPAEADTFELIDLAQFLLSRNEAALAKTLVEGKLGVEPRDIELGLLHSTILGVLGDASGAVARLNLVRDLVVSPKDYRKWLDAAINTHRRLETLPGFLEAELNRYEYDLGTWSEDKIDRFVALCEAARKDLPGARIAEGLRRQVEQPGIEVSSRQKLRRAFAAVLESNPSFSAEAAEQLRLLAAENPAERDVYDLRRALVHWREQRTGLARDLLAAVSFEAVDSPDLLREAADALLEFGLLAEAEEALDYLTRYEPKDFLGWERRISVLAALGEEIILRAMLRKLRDSGDDPALREDSRRSLGEHLVASYWRSISERIEGAEDQLASALPLLASVEAEEVSEERRLWTEWARSRILARLGRAEEAEEAIERFRRRAGDEGAGQVFFPDGLALSVAGADALIREAEPVARPSVSADAVSVDPALSWVFEMPEGVRVLRMAHAEDVILLLGEDGSVHAVEADSGKLRWRGDFPTVQSLSTRPRPAAFDAVPMPPAVVRKQDERLVAARVARSIEVHGDLFLLLDEKGLTARSVADGSVRWIAPIPAAAEETAATSWARPGRVFAVSDGIAVVFEAETGDLRAFLAADGKLLWHRKSEPGADDPGGLYSLNCGLDLHSGFGIAYGRETFVFELFGGETVWEAGDEMGAAFPVVLRPPRSDEESEEGDGKVVERVLAPQRASGEFAFFDLSAGQNLSGLVSGPSVIVGPMVRWARERRRIEAPAAVRLSNGVLWALDGTEVRRVSLSLPMGSRKLPAVGSFVGAAGEHVWFLNGSELVHADFRRSRTTRIPLLKKGNLRATLVGTQVLVRGDESFRIFNALTGASIGQVDLPELLRNYLASVPSSSPVTDPHVWQGRIARSGAGRPALCLPSQDILAGDRYFTPFGDRYVVCLEASVSADRAGRSQSAASPQP